MRASTVPMRTPFKADNRAGLVTSDLGRGAEPGQQEPWGGIPSSFFCHGRAANGAGAENGLNLNGKSGILVYFGSWLFLKFSH